MFLDDESTSALDNSSERLLHASFGSMRRDAIERGRPFTHIIVAHRSSTVRRADKIVVLMHGRIVQQGAHEELIQDQAGEYHRLYHAGELLEHDLGENATSPQTDEAGGASAIHAIRAGKDDIPCVIPVEAAQ